MSHRRIRALSLASILAAGLTPAGAGDWPNFRGPTHDGISAETGIATRWPEGGPKVLWRTALGDGYSGISVAAGRLYTMYGEGDDEYAACHDAATGKRLWRVRTDGQFKDRNGGGPRSTPTVDGDVVYVLSAEGKLQALAVADGSRIWMRDLAQDFGAEAPRWGHSTSPLIEGDRLLLNVGGSGGSSIVAFDKKSGKELWRAGEDKAGYSTPIAVTIADRRQVVFFTASNVVSVSPADGKVLWKKEWKTSYDVNAAAPLFLPPDRIFISSGYDVGSAVFRVSASGAEQLWRNREMKNKFHSSVYRDGSIYGFDEKFLTCLDAASGEARWQSRGLGHGSLIWADGHLIVMGESGTLVLVEATPEAYREQARAEIFDGKTWTAPTLAGGKLYLRDERELVALELSE